MESREEGKKLKKKKKKNWGHVGDRTVKNKHVKKEIKKKKKKRITSEREVACSCRKHFFPNMIG
jgi:hypothetical protein